ncbi:hypothetical protein G6O67_000954 [Ophiocordyceps sinensis]|uniref:chorismate mutase n=1 Tax=Ophiocordyceps sinensis TaxID=72228 RepID=A0A8H4Q0A3_9HYPO|nr:hypothetical protein G6O67_000954 [Ophiocordyceps sinensis]
MYVTRTFDHATTPRDEADASSQSPRRHNHLSPHREGPVCLEQDNHTPAPSKIPGTDLSFFDWYFSEQEKLQSLIRRYESPDEYPFFPEAVQRPILKPLDYPKILHPNTVNVNADIKHFYIQTKTYGSTATCDFACLQALSRRIHFGKLVAESKFRSNPEKYTRLIKAADRQAIAHSITNAAVEQSIFERLRLKALTYGKDPAAPEGSEGPTKMTSTPSSPCTRTLSSR